MRDDFFVLCEQADERFPETRDAASELIERLREQAGQAEQHPGRALVAQPVPGRFPAIREAATQGAILAD